MERVMVAVDIPQLGDKRRRHWAKLVTGVDASKATGWAYAGNFVSDGGVQDLPVGGVLLLYGERGSSANPTPEAALFTIGSDATLILEASASGRAWARTLRDRARDLLGEELRRGPDLSGIASEDLVVELRRRGFRIEG